MSSDLIGGEIKVNVLNGRSFIQLSIIRLFSREDLFSKSLSLCDLKSKSCTSYCKHDAIDCLIDCLNLLNKLMFLRMCQYFGNYLYVL